MKATNLQYKFEIFDRDIGANIDDPKVFETLEDLLDELTIGFVFYSPSDSLEMTPDDEQLKTDLKYWSSREALNVISEFNFFSGLAECRVWLPGRHRCVIVSAEPKTFLS